MIEKQMQEKVVPSVVAHLKGVDRVVKEQVLPQVEAQVQDMITKLVKQNKLKVMKDREDDKKNDEAKRTEKEINEMVERAVVE